MWMCFAFAVRNERSASTTRQPSVQEEEDEEREKNCSTREEKNMGKNTE
jgi:hypothetical protein